MRGIGLDDLRSLKGLSEMLAAEESLATVARALSQGESATIDGAWGSSKALAIAAVVRAHPEETAIVVVPHAGDVDAFADDLRWFSGAPVAVLPPAENRPAKRVPGLGVGDETFGRRLAVVKAVAGPDPPRLLVTSIAALLQPVVSPRRLREASRTLRCGVETPLEETLIWLVSNGWERREAVEIPGEFSVRGGILDLFPADRTDPLRVEFFGDEIESIREFAVDSQRSLRQLTVVEITALVREDLAVDGKECQFADIAPPAAWFALIEPTELQQEGKNYLSRLEDQASCYSVDAVWQGVLRHPTVVLTSLPHRTLETACSLHIESVERFGGDVAKIKDELDRTMPDEHVVIACHNDAEIKRLGDVLRDSNVALEGRLHLVLGTIASGFRWIAAKIAALSDHELFHRTDTRRAGPARRVQSRAIDSFIDLSDGDYVVHLSHGIGIFRGAKMLDKNGQLEEHLTIEFADKVLVYTPASKIDLIQKYVGGGQGAPRLAKVGGVAWERRKQQVQRAVEDLASELIDLQAARQSQPGFSYPPDTEWQQQFEAAFPFVETDDQLSAIRDIRADMEGPRAMDRLLCGDVGYGKTELAMRAAFKAVDFGKQVAVLVPTTVLAQQHFRTFRERMAEFPFSIEVLSRFETKTQQRKIIKQAAEGGVDILIGTHRLLSADVRFADLGLVVIDEEQRFGVEHKERLKRLRSQVDVLTLTATPIPRTLHFALLGIRDISNLQTPPQDRLSIETRIHRFDRGVIRNAILRELNRDGQVYFVHNRVHDIKDIANRLAQIVPEARVAIIHGQLQEHGIEEGMLAFLERRADILLATTIIESGLDIPNANTIFINEGDHYGLADLHQLRGRVGRSSHRAYCYVLVDENKSIKPDAQRRLKAIEEYSSLGSGFKIALRDLEIRGAGNILGAEQSGHIAAVGYELYCHLLENAVRSRKKQPLRTMLDVTIELPWRAYFPNDYLPGERYRLDAYRRLARIRNLDELDEFRNELRDRFGEIPDVGVNLIDLAELRILSQVWQIESIRPDDDGFLVCNYRDRRRIETLANLRKGTLRIVDSKSMYIPIPPTGRNADSYRDLLKRLLQPS